MMLAGISFGILILSLIFNIYILHQRMDNLEKQLKIVLQIVQHVQESVKEEIIKDV